MQGRIEWNSVSQGSSANSSKVSATIYARRTDGYSTWGQSWSGYVKIGSSQVDINLGSSTEVGEDWVTMATISNITVGHNPDGSGSVYISGSVTGPSGTSLSSRTSSGGATCTLDKIPRYTSITSFTVSKRNETSVTYNFTTADTCDYAWYSVNNGSSWTGVDITDGTSASFNVGSLSPNTTYNFKVRVRRKDSQLTTDSSTVSQTTYKVPTQAFSSKTETRVTMTWSIDTTADYIWYSTNNGSSWTAVGSVNATSGSYNITGLSPNTAYNIKTRVRRKAPQTTYDTTALSVTTYKAPTHSLSSKTETTATIAWTADSTVDYIWYSTDNGSSWTGVNVTDGTSGSYSISGLTANTTYQVKTRFRRKATQTNYDVGPMSVTTYNYPYVSAIGTSALVIGNSQTLTLYNPLSRSVTIKMYQNNTSGTELYSGTTSGTSKTFTPTASTLYASIPNSTSGNCVYSVIYGNSTKTTGTNTYKIIGTETPTFSNFTYADTNSITTALTGDNQILINNYSNVTATISVANKAIANNSATMKNYVLSIGGQSAQANYSDDSDVTLPISNITNNSIKVTANDSRGLGTSVTKTATIKNYVKPATTNLTATRGNNGVGEEVTISFEGTWWNDSFGLQANAIQNIAYYFKKPNDQTWITGTTTITFTTNQNTFSGSLVVEGDTETHGFDVTSSYLIKIVITDKLDYSEEYQTTIGSGTPAIAIYKDNVAIGQQYDTSEGSKLQVNGHVDVKSYKINGNPVLQQRTDGRTILLGNNGTMSFRPNGSSNGATLDTSGNMNIVGNISAGGNASITGSTTTNGLKVLGQASDKKFWTRNIVGSNTDGTSIDNLYLQYGANKPIYVGNDATYSISADGSYYNGKANSATNATNVHIQKLNSSSGAWYNVPFVGGADDAVHGVAGNDGFRHYTLQGTASAMGRSILQLGNSTSTGTAGNKRGELLLYSEKSGYAYLRYSSTTSNVNLYFPSNASDYTIQTKPKNLYNNTSGTTGTVTLSETSANFTYIEIFYGKKSDIDSQVKYNSLRVYSPNGKRANLVLFHRATDTVMQLIGATITISGTSVTKNYYHSENFYTNGTIGGGSASDNTISIFRIDGYK